MHNGIKDIQQCAVIKLQAEEEEEEDGGGGE